MASSKIPDEGYAVGSGGSYHSFHRLKSAAIGAAKARVRKTGRRVDLVRIENRSEDRSSAPTIPRSMRSAWKIAYTIGEYWPTASPKRAARRRKPKKRTAAKKPKKRSRAVRGTTARR